jgi:hypothetical protein
MYARTCYPLIFFLLFSGHSRAETDCGDPAQLARSTVSITRYFDDGERTEQASLIGIQGTGWFESPTTIVTIEHVAAAMGLSTEDWKLLNISDGVDRQSVSVRIQRLIGSGFEKLAVLKLQSAISAARSVAIRMSPLAPEDRVVTLVYPNRQQRSVSGRFVQYVDDGRLAGSALLELRRIRKSEYRFAMRTPSATASVRL